MGSCFREIVYRADSLTLWGPRAAMSMRPTPPPPPPPPLPLPPPPAPAAPVAPAAPAGPAAPAAAPTCAGDAPQGYKDLKRTFAIAFALTSLTEKHEQKSIAVFSMRLCSSGAVRPLRDLLSAPSKLAPGLGREGARPCIGVEGCGEAALTPESHSRHSFSCC